MLPTHVRKTRLAMLLSLTEAPGKQEVQVLHVCACHSELGVTGSEDGRSMFARQAPNQNYFMAV